MKIELHKLENSGGKIFYGMHFYPGVAQYNEKGKDPYRIFLNEDTLRKLDPTFAGKPIFVEHVDEVDKNIDTLRNEADGWVVESFFNSADGKHWCKFIVVSKRAETAIQNGFRLSNAYIPQMNGRAGEWNAVSYQNEVVGGEYEHLAIVKSPRYEESVILTPEEFKAYNSKLTDDLKRISNSKKETPTMLSKLVFWNRKPAESSLDIENTFVTLPKSRKEFSIEYIVNAMDEYEEKRKLNAADLESIVTLNDKSTCKVSELVEKFETLSNAAMKKDCMNKKKNKEEEGKDEEDDEEKPFENEEDEGKKEKEEDEEADEKDDKKNKKKNKMKNSGDSSSAGHFDALKNAPIKNGNSKEPTFDLYQQVTRGKALFGSDQ